jgi:hypothetical protein
VPDPELGDTYSTDPATRMASRVGEHPHEPLDDLDRAKVAGEPPVPGAQWDELHSRWERWDDDAQAWVVVGDSAGDGVSPLEENPLPPLLAREQLLADDLDAAASPVSDVVRAPAHGPGPEGAQWNEVADRWERWDEGRQAWVEALADPPG